MQASLSLSQQQQLQMILAPHLRQSLEILQMPIMELRQFLAKELQQNPTLEETLPDTPSIEIEGNAGPDTDNDGKELNFKAEFDMLAQMDDEWKQYFRQEHDDGAAYDGDREKKRDFFMDSLVQRPSLQDHLLKQLELAGLGEADRKIGELIVGNINNDGYLTQEPSELAESIGEDAGHIQDVLSVIQDFDPVGVGARNLKECLSIQLERLGHADSTAHALVNGHLETLAAKHFKDAAKALDVDIQEIQAAARLIATLDPRPGHKFSSETAPYVAPDLIVYKTDGRYAAMLSDEQIPRLRISKQYKTLMGNSRLEPDVENYIKDRIRSGMFIIKSIAQRKQTLLNVGNEIVRAQSDFLEHGISMLKPLTMAEVASRLDIHETTVCRCLANKYIQTPQGLFEMKFFFTPGLKTEDGREISTKTVKDIVRDLVKNEPKSSPLTDQDIKEMLKAKGMDVARRTVAKYRVELKIPPSHLRKGFA